MLEADRAMRLVSRFTVSTLADGFVNRSVYGTVRTVVWEDAGGDLGGSYPILRPAWAHARRCGVRGACQVLYRPGRGNGELKARVPVVRRDLKEAGDKPLARRTETA